MRDSVSPASRGVHIRQNHFAGAVFFEFLLAALFSRPRLYSRARAFYSLSRESGSPDLLSRRRGARECARTLSEMAGLRAVVLIWIPAFAGKGLARGIRAARGAKACNAKALNAKAHGAKALNAKTNQPAIFWNLSGSISPLSQSIFKMSATSTARPVSARI